MSLETRIKRWYYEAQRRGITLQSILIHPNDYDRACRDFPFLPIRVLGYQIPAPEMPEPSAGPNGTSPAFYPLETP